MLNKTIEAKELVKVYRGRAVVDGISLSISQGEIVGLLGKNGAGKTTTFYMIVGLVQPNRGRVLLEGNDITRLPMYARARRGIGYLAQEASVFRKLSARENILLVLEQVGYPARERRKRADELLEEFTITHKADSPGYSLSGGERRRVEIARALAADPAFLLLDEPFAGIDPKVRKEISDIIRRLCEKGIGILITDHDERTTLRLTDRAYIIADGRVMTEGTSEEIASDPVAREYYLTEDFTL
ncbi:MAG: LPS export ABC transporter ATP-binding protein [Capsulimonadales bacterium]|nr:LPS export ABC transporter ATP-binding protein [Capsulimonadales bacterium]